MHVMTAHHRRKIRRQRKRNARLIQLSSWFQAYCVLPTANVCIQLAFPQQVEQISHCRHCEELRDAWSSLQSWVCVCLQSGWSDQVQESGELAHSSSAAGPAAGPSGRGGPGGAKGHDTVVHVGDPGRGCCGMAADPLLAATLIGKPSPRHFLDHVLARQPM